MSAQFGIWNRDGRPVDREHLERARELLAPYGPDVCDCYLQDDVAMLYCGFHTTTESVDETQPHTLESGEVIAWDGRLDNRSDLILDDLGALTPASTDLAVVAASYQKRGTSCFANLVGDWATSIWDPRKRTLILAKDAIGLRHLYYVLDAAQLRWSTVLDPLVLLSARPFVLEEEYIAGWLSFFPGAQLTPFAGVRSVPPSTFLAVQPSRSRLRKYWEFDGRRTIRCHSDGEYEERFREVFATSVRRRLRCNAPIVAELSGGMDSSSIVCMADRISAGDLTGAVRVETLSYFTEAEPHWNEQPYFSKVEEKRGRTGYHIDLGYGEFFQFDTDGNSFSASPSRAKRVDGVARQFNAFLQSRNARVVLSGIGGDELMGGVPTPTPELEDLFAKAQFIQLAQRLKLWALDKRKPWVHLLFQTLRAFCPPALMGVPKHRRPADWLDGAFVARNGDSLNGYEHRLKLFGSRPSFQENVFALDALRRQLACQPQYLEPVYEKRYPYLDRDLLEFIYAIPREQLVRPGQRRSLMRRAMRGIVPDEILNRKRKAFAGRTPMTAVLRKWSELNSEGESWVSASFGIIDLVALGRTLERLRQGLDVPIVHLVRSFYLELWLRKLRRQGILAENGQLFHNRAHVARVSTKSQLREIQSGRR